MTSSAAVTPGPQDPAVTSRSSYHHGDLRRALLEAGTELAREGGPGKVVLREATRRVGVSANAAYRHFADRGALLDAVVGIAQSRAADVMSATIEAAGRGMPPADRARQRFQAVGVGYLRFAMDEPGLFRTAFAVPVDLSRSGSPDSAGACGRTPFQLLTDALDDLAEVGALPAAERLGAELLAWSAVHGLAMLALEGPLRDLPTGAVDELAPRVVRMVALGLGVVEPSEPTEPTARTELTDSTQPTQPPEPPVRAVAPRPWSARREQ